MNITRGFRTPFAARTWVITFLLFAITLFVSPSARATDNYEYGPGEYVTIARGISPRRQFCNHHPR